MSKLYEIANQYLALSELADDPDFPVEAIADTLESIEGELEVKAEALLQVVTNLEGDTGKIDVEIKRLQARKQVIQNRADSLREYLRQNMIRTGIEKISCPLFSITLAKGRPMVIVDDLALVPERYIKTTVTIAPVKDDILKALKAGEVVPGCVLGESKRALLIK